MRKNHMIGITPPRINNDLTEDSFAFSKENLMLMKDAKIEYVRMPLSFPFTDSNMDTLTEKYLTEIEAIKKMAEHGLKSLASFPLPGSYRYSPKTNKVEYVYSIPKWVGDYDEDEFYKRIDFAAEFMGRATKDLVEWWQVANEPDIDVFIGEMTHEENERFLETAARGLKKGNLNAKCGINIAGVGTMGEGDGTLGIHPYAKRLIEKLYTDSGYYDYMGLDGYFGTWSKGRPEDWTAYIDAAHGLTKKPIIINEWGYSTLQRGEPRSEKDKDRHFNSVICREKDWDANPGFKWLGVDHSDKLQKDYILKCLKIFADHPAVIGNFFFQWQDQENCWQCGEPDCPAECGWGCIRVDRTPKEGYYGLKEGNALYFE